LGMELSEIGIKNKFKFGVQIDLNLWKMMYSYKN
jgi:hypothetical protein